MSGARRPLVGGNWKMNLLAAEGEALAGGLADETAGAAAEVVLFPSHPLLARVATALGSAPIAVGGQDLHPEVSGAHTGDVSGPQLVDAGCSWVLCGHSERRQDHGECDALVGCKVEAAIEHGLVPLLCVGETADERRAGETRAVVERQLAAGIASRPPRFALAYEPIWAIGTGDTATPAEAQEVHAHLREVLADLVGSEIADARRILYGGSVKAENAADLIAQSDIDGFLVGGASLDVSGFSAIIRCCG